MNEGPSEYSTKAFPYMNNVYTTFEVRFYVRCLRASFHSTYKVANGAGLHGYLSEEPQAVNIVVSVTTYAAVKSVDQIRTFIRLRPVLTGKHTGQLLVLRWRNA